MPINPLALLVSQRNPALSGLLSSQTGGLQVRAGPGVPTPTPVLRPSVAAPARPAAPPPTGAPSGGGFFDSLLGGRDPNLSDAANRRATNQGLTQAGLSILAGATRQEGTGSALANIAQGLMAGRAHSEEFRQQAFQTARAVAADERDAQESAVRVQSAELDLMRRQARMNAMAGIDLTNPNSRMAGMMSLGQSGDLEGVGMLENIDRQLRDRTEEERYQITREFIQDQIDWDNAGPDEFLNAAARLTASGFGDEAQAYQGMAESMLRMQSAQGIQQWLDKGDMLVGVGPDGTVLAEYKKGLSPEAIQAQMRHDETMRFNLAKAGSDREMQAVERIGNDWRQEAGALAEAGRFYSLAMGADNTLPGINSLVNALNKLTDPDSVVRQSEFNRTAEGRAILDRAKQIAERFNRGGVSVDLYEEIKDEVQRLATDMQAFAEDTIIQPYLRRMDTFGVENADYEIVRDYFNPGRRITSDDLGRPHYGLSETRQTGGPPIIVDENDPLVQGGYLGGQ